MTGLIQQIVGYTLTALGALFYFYAGLGLLRMPDFYTKLQASTKATTLGTFSVALGVGILNPAFLGKALLLIAFIALTNPVASSVMIRAAYKNKVPACKETVVDEIASVYTTQENGGENHE
ncbi:Membrane bound protein complex subunit mbxC [Fervidobacterium changbaicum]|uniref:Monovalent cation/H(+) antiporter subunit G n=2 Tax=Fervidobacterium TaxID=2422 RepID=A0AAI8CN60_FERIS|nr:MULTISPECIES: monovalent cation/H(+) antiporter subunit G [Fervidobacterium]AMW33556.1 monovalent cation/H(+) antiporter subunit G [Fervidobacterium islandicum]QAV33618.1 Na+/H+ antiporter subunit G [Fervidobacterium changbaicum]SDH71972.1 Membrane bound protein complex subunit mbxC [Fervidobacterium changbaicum]